MWSNTTQFWFLPFWAHYLYTLSLNSLLTICLNQITEWVCFAKSSTKIFPLHCHIFEWFYILLKSKREQRIQDVTFHQKRTFLKPTYIKVLLIKRFHLSSQGIWQNVLKTRFVKTFKRFHKTSFTITRNSFHLVKLSSTSFPPCDSGPHFLGQKKQWQYKK